MNTAINETEPVGFSVLIGTVVSSAVALLALLFPARLTPELQAAIIVFANAVIAVLVALFARKGSTPIAKPVLTAGTPVTTPDGQAALVTPQ